MLDAMKFLPLFLFWLFIPGQQQTSPSARASDANISNIYTVRGFLDVCGIGEKASKITMDRIKNDPGFTAFQAMDAKTAETALCVGYSMGLIDGWKEGHARGVLAAHFPKGIPDDLTVSYKSMPTEELKSIGTAMDNGVPCIPESTSVGETRDAIIKYARAQTSKLPMLGLVPISRFVGPALLEAFPCLSSPPAKK